MDDKPKSIPCPYIREITRSPKTSTKCPAKCPESLKTKGPIQKIVMVHCALCDKQMRCVHCALTDILGPKCSKSYTLTVLEALKASEMWLPICGDCVEDDDTPEAEKNKREDKITALSGQLEEVQQQISDLTDKFSAISDCLQTPAQTPAPRQTSYASIVRTGKQGLPVPTADHSLFDKAQTELVRVQDWEREVRERQKRELNLVMNGLADNDSSTNEIRERVNDMFVDLEVDSNKILNVRTFTINSTKQVEVIVELKELQAKKDIMTRKRAVLTSKRQYNDVYIGSEAT